MFGLEGEESQMSSNLRKSRDWFSKKSSQGIRKSIAQKFFMQRDTESQHSVFNSNLEKQITLNHNSTIAQSEYTPITKHLLALQIEREFPSANVNQAKNEKQLIEMDNSVDIIKK